MRYSRLLNPRVTTFDMYKLSMGFKIGDVIVNTIRLSYMPIIDNFNKLTLDNSLVMIGLFGLCDSNLITFSSLAVSHNTVNKMLSGKYFEPLALFVNSAFYYSTGLKRAQKISEEIFPISNSPKAYFRAVISIYEICNSLQNAIALIDELTDPEFIKKSQEVKLVMKEHIDNSVHYVFCEKIGICIDTVNDIKADL